MVFFPDVVFCCALLHNVLLNETNEVVENLLEVLRAQGERDPVADSENFIDEVDDALPLDHEWLPGNDKHRELGIILSIQRGY